MRLDISETFNVSVNSSSFETMSNKLNYSLTLMFILIEIVGILGNTLVIIAVEFDGRMRRSLTNQLIVRVASCDLLILLFNLPDLIQFVSSPHSNWILDRWSCKFIRTILVLVQYASVLTMCVLTIERYPSTSSLAPLLSRHRFRFIGIVYPLRSKFLVDRRHLLNITFLVWLLALICAWPNLVYLRVLTDSSLLRRSCVLQYSTNDPWANHLAYLIHKSLESFLFYFLPLLLQFFCYWKIARRLSHVDESLQSSFRRFSPPIYRRTQVCRSSDKFQSD